MEAWCNAGPPQPPPIEAVDRHRDSPVDIAQHQDRVGETLRVDVDQQQKLFHPRGRSDKRRRGRKNGLGRLGLGINEAGDGEHDEGP